MTTATPLDAFFRPRGIAVVGASGDLGKMASRPIVYLRKNGYAGRIIAVNPKYQELGGVPCVAEIDALPDGLDLALISLPAALVPDAVRRCGARGIRVVTILSGGFGELGTDEGRALDEALRQAVRESGVRVCGPNCQGGINLFERTAATYSGALSAETLQAGPIALITQSGVFGGLVFAAAQEEGIGVGFWTSTGNELDLTFCDYLDYVAGDPRVRVVGGYLESVKDDGARFVASLRKVREAGKPVVVLKTGRTEAGQAAAASHTAALAGSDEGYSAAFRRGGAVRADSAEHFRDLVAAFSTGRVPRGKRVAVLSISGGAATLMADECSERGLELAAFSADLRARLATVVPVFGSVANPVDLTGQLVADAALLEKSTELVLESGEADVVCLFIGMCDGNKDELVEVIGRLAAKSDLPIMVTWVAASDPGIYSRIRERGVPVFHDPTACMATVAGMVAWVEQVPPIRPSEAADTDTDVEAANARLLAALRERPAGMMTEASVKALLVEAGLPVPSGYLVNEAAEAHSAVAAVGGDAVMKLQAVSIPHKSDIGGVSVGVSVERAEAEFTRLRSLFPADAEGVLVEQRIRNASECFIGVQRHPVFGPLIAVGLGGVFIEVFRDVAIRLAPVDHDEALAMIRSLKGHAILAGTRGRPAHDVQALAALVERISRIAAAGADCIQELDLNPVFTSPRSEGVWIGDALLVRR